MKNVFKHQSYQSSRRIKSENYGWECNVTATFFFAKSCLLPETSLIAAVTWPIQMVISIFSFRAAKWKKKNPLLFKLGSVM